MEWFTDRTRFRSLILAVCFLAGSWMWFTRVQGSSDPEPANPFPGFQAPDFTLTDLTGKDQTLSDLKGKVVLINFWASWCGPCRKEMPIFQTLADEYREQEFVVLAINTTYQDSSEAAAAFVAEYRLTYPILLDQTGQTAASYRLNATPTTFLVDTQGEIRQVLVGGGLDEAYLRSLINSLLEVR